MMKVKKLNDDHIDFIEICLRENPELTSREMCNKKKSVFGINVSVTTVRRTRVTMGWTSRNTRYCQTVRSANIPKRFEHALNCIKNN
ncbi:hypothetical protein ACF0H5_015875 [Mactra antiquata]